MHTSKLFLYLDKLTEKEWKPLKKFIRGNRGEHVDCHQLFSYIYEYRKDLSQSGLHMGVAHKALFPHLSRKSFQNVMSELTKEIEEFWVWYDLKQDDVKHDSLKFESLNRRGIYDEADRCATRVRSRALEKNKLDLWPRFYVLRVFHERYFSNNPVKGRPGEGNDLFRDMLYNLRIVASNFAEYYKAEICNIKYLRREDWDEELSEITSYILNPFDRLSQCLRDQSQMIADSYKNLPNSLLEAIELPKADISDALRLTFYYRVRSHLIKRTRAGDVEAYKMLEEIIMNSANSNILMYDGQIALIRFIGDINLLCSMKKSKVARDYVQQYSSMVEKNYRQDSYNLGILLVLFSEGEYRAVIDNSRLSSFKKASHKLHATVTFLKSYYEIQPQEADFLLNQLRNLKDFIKRNAVKLSKNQAEGWYNFAKFFEMLLNHKQRGRILNLMNNESNLPSRSWLLKVVGD